MLFQRVWLSQTRIYIYYILFTKVLWFVYRIESMILNESTVFFLVSPFIPVWIRKMNHSLWTQSIFVLWQSHKYCFKELFGLTQIRFYIYYILITKVLHILYSFEVYKEFCIPSPYVLWGILLVMLQSNLVRV